MTQDAALATWIFSDRREAVGWLLSRWTGALIAVLVWVLLLAATPTTADRPGWLSVVSTLLLVVLGGLNIWAFRVGSTAGPRFRDAMQARGVPRWQREQLASEQAAIRLQWPPSPVVWGTLGLAVVAAVTTVAALTVLVLRWA